MACCRVRIAKYGKQGRGENEIALDLLLCVHLWCCGVMPCDVCGHCVRAERAPVRVGASPPLSLQQAQRRSSQRLLIKRDSNAVLHDG